MSEDKIKYGREWKIVGDDLVCRILCTKYDNEIDEQESRNGKSVWLRAVVDLSEIKMIKENGRDENSNFTVLYDLAGCATVVEINYAEFETEWLKWRIRQGKDIRQQALFKMN